MADQLFNYLMSNSAGSSGLFLGLFLLLFFYSRKDSIAHRREVVEMNKQLIQIIIKNTESNTKLADTIRDLRIVVDNIKK